MSLLGRLNRLESEVLGGGPLTITIWAGAALQESWIEWSDDRVAFFVRVPDDAHPMEHLTDEMRRMLDPGDVVTIFRVSGDGRNPHLQRAVPPWGRRPYRLDPSGRSYELQAPDGSWERFEFR
jgi:hypothetical protein